MASYESVEVLMVVGNDNDTTPGPGADHPESERLLNVDPNAVVDIGYVLPVQVWYRWGEGNPTGVPTEDGPVMLEAGGGTWWAVGTLDVG